jgi:plastocyanin
MLGTQFQHINAQEKQSMRSSTLTPLAKILPRILGIALVVIAQGAQAQWRAAVGAQSRDLGRQALAFLPNEIWIHAGDTITWTFETDEIHTVSFLRTLPPPSQIRPPFAIGCPGFTGDTASFDGSACITTPPLTKGATFTVTFPNAGNYKLVCLVHASMTATIHVLDLSAPLPHQQSFYDEQAAAQRKELLTDTDGDQNHHHGDHDSDRDQNHVTTGVGEIVATGGGHNSVSLMRFLHPEIVTHVGETVEWTNVDPGTPHTITFGVEPANPNPPSANVEIDADGARHATINSTSDSVHSGFILAEPQERGGLPQAPLGVTRFRITFTQAGTYNYICALHDGLGMRGRVIVLP